MDLIRQLDSRLLLWTAILSLCIVLISRLRRSGKSDIKLIPGPPRAHWLWGNEYDIFEHSYDTKFSEWFAKYGTVVRYKPALFLQDIITSSDPKIMQHVFTDHPYDYVKSSFWLPILQSMLGKVGVIASEGDQHKRQRKLLNPSFSAANVREMTPTVLDSASAFTQRFVKHIQDRGGNCVVDMTTWTPKYTLDVICKVGFGHDTQGGQSPAAIEINTAARNQVNEGITMASFYGIAVVRLLPFLTRLPLKSYESLKRTYNVISKLSMELYHQNGENEEKNLMSRIMKMDSIDTQEVVDNIVTLVFAGNDTTSSTLNMLLYELSKNQDIQSRLRAELLSLGREPDVNDFTNSDALPYLDAVVKEGLRVHPAGLSTERVALKDDVLPLSKPILTTTGETLDRIHIKAGQVIIFPLKSMNVVDAVWGDGKVFRPERWIKEDGLPPKDELFRGPIGLTSFLEGPRVCLGYRLAMLELKVGLAMLIRHLVFHDVGVNLEMKLCITGQPRVVGQEDKGVQLPLRVSLYGV